LARSPFEQYRALGTCVFIESMSEFLKSWFPFRGRIGRRQYWISTLLYLFVWVWGPQY
jgi:hypothetical protein